MPPLVVFQLYRGVAQMTRDGIGNYILIKEKKKKAGDHCFHTLSKLCLAVSQHVFS
jgi:hypothetical protein